MSVDDQDTGKYAEKRSTKLRLDLKIYTSHLHVYFLLFLPLTPSFVSLSFTCFPFTLVSCSLPVYQLAGSNTAPVCKSAHGSGPLSKKVIVVVKEGQRLYG